MSQMYDEVLVHLDWCERKLAVTPAWEDASSKKADLSTFVPMAYDRSETIQHLKYMIERMRARKSVGVFSENTGKTHRWLGNIHCLMVQLRCATYSEIAEQCKEFRFDA
jgi:hypothetical protein